MIDDRKMEGKFVALDSKGALVMTGATEHSRRGTRKLERVIIPLAWIQQLEASSPAPPS
jgi:hypothetical protein